MAAHRYWRLKIRGSAVVGDPNWDAITALLHFDGADGSTTITDEKGSTWTATTGVISTAQSKFGGASLGAGTVTRAAGISMTGDFTVEAWVYLNGTGQIGLLANGSAAAGRTIFFVNNRLLYLDRYGVGSYQLGSAQVPLNTWVHIAFVRSAGVVTGYINGVAGNTPYTNSSTYGNGGGLSSYIAGGLSGYYMDELLIEAARARYTTNFTPPTAPYAVPYVGVGELQMRASIGGSNILTGGTISASDSISPYTAAKAVDGLTADTGSGNGWLGSYPGWLMYDFGAGNEKAIQELVIYAPGTGGLTADQLPTNWDLEWSDDNINWLKQRSYDFDISTSAWGLSESRVYDVRKPVPDHSQLLFSRIASHVYTAPGEPTVPVYDPGAESGKIRALDRTRFAADLNHGGQYKLAGTTTVLGDPAPRRVRLYHQFDGRLYAEMYTAVDGAFEFRNIELGPWTVVGIDDTGTYNGVIYTHVNAVPM